jgi:RimJ/RimL family protein N-acetyltransferase
MITAKDRADLLLFGQQTGRLYFRKLDSEDFDTWLRFCEDPDSLRYFAFSETDPADVKCQQWFDKIAWRYENSKGGMNALIDKESGRFVGQCGLLVQTVDEQEELEIGYSLMPESRGLGYALEAAAKCRDHAFQNELADSLISIIHPDNIASQNVALKNGMKLSKQTVYSGMPVNIYRIMKAEWKQIQ